MKFFSLGAGNRIFGLDLLRFFAIMYVVLGHSKILLPEKYDAYIGKTILDGVSIFFVLSGFLIGQILIKQINRGETSFKNLFHFWTRRWMRTLPAYFFTLTILVIYTACLKPVRLPEDWYKYFLFLQNFFTPQPPFFTESWSLSVEEWFYLMIPILFFFGIYLFSKNKKNVLFFLIFFIIVLVISYRYFMYYELVAQKEKYINSILSKQVFPRLDGIMVGVLGAFCNIYFQKTWNKLNHWYIFLLMFIVLYLMKQFASDVEGLHYCVFMPFFKSLAVFFMLPFLSKFEIQRSNFTVKFVTFVSVTSYSMYLLNRTIVIDIVFKYLLHDNLVKKHIFNENWIVEYILFWIITFALSFLMYKLIEKPFLKLRDFIEIGKKQ